MGKQKYYRIMRVSFVCSKGDNENGSNRKEQDELRKFLENGMYFCLGGNASLRRQS